MMQLVVNGETMVLPEGSGIEALLEQLGADAARVALLVNDRPVRRADWPSIALHEADRVEVLTFAGGG